MNYFGVDYGEIVGFSLLDESGEVILIGSSKDSQICIEQIKLAFNYYSDITLVIEKQIGVKTERFTKFIETVDLLCILNKVDTIEILPHIWKNSFINKSKIKPTNHAIDSAKIALFGAYSKNK